jgi:two-component system OmpR family response regulator
VRFADLILDLDACTLARESGKTIALTHGEFGLLRVFVSRPGRALSREAISCLTTSTKNWPDAVAA